MTQDLDLSQHRTCFVAVITINQTNRFIFTLSKKIFEWPVLQEARALKLERI